MKLNGARAIVTGGAGFIGSHLVDHLLAQGASVTVIDDFSTGSRGNLEHTSVDVVEGDIRDRSIAARCVDADIVFHLAVRNVRASIEQPGENLDVNARGTLEPLEAMRRAGGAGRFLYTSSSEVYGIPDSLVFSEETVPAPTTVYGAGKLAGEHITHAYRRTYGMETAVVRPFNNYGPRSHFEGDSGEVIPKFILRALAGRPLIVHGDGSQTRDFMFVRDCAEWIARIGADDVLVGETVNIGTGIEVSVNDLAGTVIEKTRSTSAIQHVEPRPGDLPRLCADVRRISDLTDFSLSTGFDAGLDETIEHFATQDVERLLDAERERNWK
jgi:UDP-glucose 4-epimerase